MLQQLSSHKYLIMELSKREVKSRYKGSFLGIFWALLTPLAMLLVFTFVFGEIFQAKWPNTQNQDSMVTFSVNLFAGLSFFWFFSDVIAKSPTIFSSVPNYIKKVIFPLWILPLVSLFGALFHYIVYLFILFGAVLLSGSELHLSILAVPFIVALSFPLLVGFSLFLGSLGVFVKDINTIIGVIVNMLIFLSPVFYPLSNIPQKLQWLFYLNPLTYIIEALRGALMHGLWPSVFSMGVYLLVSLAVLALGVFTFRFTYKGFADVL